MKRETMSDDFDCRLKEAYAAAVSRGEEPTGCSLVAEVLTRSGYPISEKEAEDIWNRYGDWVRCLLEEADERTKGNQA